jgi:hypothetical protein
MTDFEHERLNVYQAAIQFLALADTITGSLPRGRSYLADQLRRAASSISFNIAEGAGRQDIGLGLGLGLDLLNRSKPLWSN